MTPEQRSLRARIGGYARAAKHDGRAMTQAARDRFLERFEDEVDPDRELPEDERLRRAEAARKAHMTRLAYLSAQARKRR